MSIGKKERSRDASLRRDLKTLALFIRIYCDDLHADRERERVVMRTHDVAALAGREVILCAECRKLLMHAFVKRSSCPLDPKPMCKHCPQHCYVPAYRQQIQQVMKYSGRKLVMHGRVDYLLHLLF